MVVAKSLAKLDLADWAPRKLCSNEPSLTRSIFTTALELTLSKIRDERKPRHTA